MCTAALSLFLGYPFSAALTRELERIKAEAIYQQAVFLVRNLGFITPTDARRISFEQALAFERIHEEAYQNLGFGLVSIEPGNLAERCRKITSLLDC